MRKSHGPVVVQIPAPKPAKTFQDYADNIIHDFEVCEKMKNKTSFGKSLSLHALKPLVKKGRLASAEGCHHQLLSLAIRQGFVFDENKRERFGMLASTLTGRAAPVKQLVNTHSDSVLSSQPMSDASSLQLCCLEEADGRITIDIYYFATRCTTRIIVKTTDRDVVAPAVANAQKISTTEIWVPFGVGKNFSCILAFQIASQLGPRQGRARTQGPHIHPCLSPVDLTYWMNPI